MNNLLSMCGACVCVGGGVGAGGGGGEGRVCTVLCRYCSKHE